MNKTFTSRSILLLLVSLTLSTFAYSQSAKVSLDVKNLELSKVLTLIEQQSDYYFTYTPAEIDASRTISMRVDHEDVSKVLNTIFLNYPVKYTSDGKHIVLYQSSKSNSSTATETNNANESSTITGTVIDEQGQPLVGVTVRIENTTKGTITDTNGHFELTVNNNKEVLEFSYIGFTSVVLPANKKTYKITLKSDEKKLSEVVVVGYTTQKRVNLTGAVSSISNEAIKSRPVDNPISALQGEIPGMVVTRGSGQPGKEDFNISIRGSSSVNGNGAPLVLIDGISGDMNTLNPNDIQSISVLKDAQASIYGSRASGGVILVTTKKGKSGKPTISYSNNFAITKPTGMMKSPTTYQMAIMDNEANIHNGAIPLYTDDYLQRILNNDPNPIDHPLYGGWKLFFTNTDWMHELLKNGFQQNHSLTISGGSEKSHYFLSAGYINKKGVVRYADNGNERYNLRLNYDYQLLKRVKLEAKVSLENQTRTDIGGVGDWVIGEGIFDMPNTPVYNAQGNFFAQGGWSNAVAMAKEGATSTFKTSNVNTNFKMTTDLIQGMKLILQAGINHSFTFNKDPSRAVPLYNWDNNINYYAIASTPEQASLTQTSSDTWYRNYTGYLQYHLDLGKIHSIDAMVGVAHEENDYENFGATRDGFSDNGLWELNMGGTGNMKNTGGGNDWAISSLFGRVGYVFKNKYIVETNMRYDGSSRFAQSDKRWGFFPGVSVGWRMGQEQFMQSFTFLDELKLRASYGETGNQEGIGLYDFIQKIAIGNQYPFGDGSKTQTAHLDGMVSTNRTWETIVNQNIGIDAALLKNRLTFSFDYFIKRNKDMLIPITYPSILGSVAPSSNSGEMKTNGFETSLGWKDQIGKVNYFVKLVLSDAQDKVVNYGGGDTYVLGLNSIRQGYPMNSYFAYQFDGVIRTQAELDEYKKLEGVPSNIKIGDARFADLNKDGKISAYANDGSDGDLKYVGNTSPRYNYGINLGAKVKRFDVSIFLQGVGKRTLFRTGDYSMPWSDWWRQPPAFYYGQTWNEDRPNAYYPELSHGDIRNWNYQASTMQAIDASYIRLKNLQIGYTLPESVLKRVSISNLRVYFSGQDLWEYDHVLGGWDPESADWGGNYPFQRFYSFGLDVTF